MSILEDLGGSQGLEVPDISSFSLEQRKCTDCSKLYTISPLDKLFYWKVGPIVDGQKFAIPYPEFCRHCRRERRLLHRNHTNFYMTACDQSGRKMLSTHHPGKHFPVYFHETWWEKKRRALEFGREIDFSRPFFDQLAELQTDVPVESMRIVNSDNSEFCNGMVDCRDCYLCTGCRRCWDCMFLDGCRNCKNTHLAWQSDNLELCYHIYRGSSLFSCLYCEFCFGGSDLSFCRLCFDCRHCFGCVNLRHRKYCIFNKQYSKEDYFRFIRRINLGSHLQVEKFKAKTKQFFNTVPAKGMLGWKNEDCIGDIIFESRNCDRCFSVSNCENSSFLGDVKATVNSLDLDYCGKGSGLCYESVHCDTLFHTCFSYNCYRVSDSFYVTDSIELRHCFGSIGLYQEHHCILNKRYNPRDYTRMLKKLIEHMLETGEWGKPLPPQLSRYGYNESTASGNYQLTKSQAIEKGYRWSDYSAVKETHGKTIIESSELEDDINDTKDDVLDLLITCELTGRLYKTQKRELNFHRRLGIPLPRRGFPARFKEIKSRRNKMEFYSRRCEHEWPEEGEIKRCKNTFYSTYSETSPQVLLCESCFEDAFFYKGTNEKS